METFLKLQRKTFLPNPSLPQALLLTPSLLPLPIATFLLHLLRTILLPILPPLLTRPTIENIFRG